MLESTISGTPRFATFPTDPDSTQMSYPSMWAMRADNGSKMFAARVHVGLASTLRNRSRTWDIVCTSSMSGLSVSVNHLMRRQWLKAPMVDTPAYNVTSSRLKSQELDYCSALASLPTQGRTMCHPPNGEAGAHQLRPPPQGLLRGPHGRPPAGSAALDRASRRRRK